MHPSGESEVGLGTKAVEWWLLWAKKVRSVFLSVKTHICTFVT
jgi:hypothetical protein